MKLFVKGSKKTASSLSVLLDTFTVGDYFYTQKKSSLYRFEEGSILHQNLQLRENWDAFEAAICLVKALLVSQMPGKAAPKLYTLFRLFLEQLTCSPAILRATFFVKILKHEGILHLSDPSALSETYRFGGEVFHENTPSSIAFSVEEEAFLFILSETTSLTKLSSLDLPKTFEEKIALLFDQTYTQMS